MDKKTLLAVGLSLLIWVVWEKTYLEPIQRQAALEHQRQEALNKQKLQAQSSDKVSDAGIQALKKPAVSAPLAVEPKNLQIENATSKLLVSNEIGRAHV